MVVRRLPENSELYHHGIKGQRWGIRRFQNLDGTLTGAGRKKRGLIEQIKYNRKMKKVRRAKVEKAKAQQKAKEEQAERLRKMAAERKERAEVIKTGNAKDIQKFQHKMSDKEYEKALQRVKYNQVLSDYASEQARTKALKAQAKLDTIMNLGRTVSDVAGSAASVYGSLEKMGIIKKKETVTPLDKLRNKRDRLNLELDIKDLEWQKKEQSSQKRPDELSRWKREAEITKAMADVTKNNRVINGEDIKQKQVSGITMDELIAELDRRGLY